MNKSSNNESRNKYPTKISNELSKINKVNLAKIDNRELLIHTRWEEMVGNFFSIYSEPDKLKIFNDNNTRKIYSGVLYVKIVGAAAIEFQHFIDKIIDKINSFFGYQLITKIVLKQVSALGNNNKKSINSPNNNNIFRVSKDDKIILKENTKGIKSKKLEKTLLKLGESILKDKDKDKS